MPTQEERLIALEQTTREYRPVLQNFADELTMVKGLIIDQTGITQELRQDISEIAKRLDQTDTRLDRIETLLTQILARLPKAP
jgi:seryl-tRNA synthetase